MHLRSRARGILTAIEMARGESWTSPEAPDHEDWALLLERDADADDGGAR